ncbi:DUF6290 family protein [Corynebacterium cystitidis]|uniref:Ribbon-helix-helix protein, copG family n=1 Tax=Corynebacterium cystitidis DSM 20524 TaxID=1121357 RepID=A0A1H9QPS5_9CORY|nr:DUF6290 family protein [Corynebacterium cystitidis]WJY81704.1 Ribbon-helix-helix protein, copG family [Corynebacterium cystitidis DSM 20524]SER62417.1 Ribbon-helix-helix protein, copG family [Corynebacterium cystitidis DSM 20524]SNV84695.1 Ribbon-helix-helix protein, copG family [Corynebacterium cystitidis]
MPSSTLSIRIDDEDKKLIADYATTMNVSVGEFVRRAALEKSKTNSTLQSGTKQNANTKQTLKRLL